MDPGGHVLVSQTEPLVEQFSRQPDGIWPYRTLGPGDTLVLASLDCSILIDRVYVEVCLPSTSAG
jgi:hypothetical protein